MAWKFSRLLDIKPPRFPEVNWDGDADAKSLEQLRGRVIALADTAIEWYVRKRSFKRFWGRVTRFTAMLATAVAGGIPVIVQIFGHDGKPAFDPSWATLALGFAAFLISLDYFFAFTSAWVRYLETHLQIARATEEFQFDWESLRAGWASGQPNREQIQLALARLKQAALRVHQIVEEETGVWATEFRSALKQLDEAARAKAESVSLPGVNITVSNGADVEDEWTLVIDGGTPTTHKGVRAALVNILPGSHKFAVEGKIAGAVKRDEQAVEIPPRGVAAVSLTLR